MVGLELLMENRVLLGIVGFIFGAIVGSFLNVLIYRLPREMDVVFLPSHCVSCKTPLKWWHNIPLLSWLLLRGKCYYCRAPISARYFVVELLMASATAWFLMTFGLSINFLVVFLFTAICIPVFFIDWDFQIIPDELSIGGAVLGLLLALLKGTSISQFQAELVSWLDIFLFGGFTGISGVSHMLGAAGFWDALAGAVAGGIIYFVFLYALPKLVYKKDVMGWGDIKFAMAIGAFLGLPLFLLATMLAMLLGALYGMPVMLANFFRARKEISRLEQLLPYHLLPYPLNIVLYCVYSWSVELIKDIYIPFGPFMVLGALSALLAGNLILEAYIKLFNAFMGF